MVYFKPGALAGYDLHPTDPIKRANNEPHDEHGFGKGAIVATGAVVTRDVHDLCIVAGNPARVVKELDEYKQVFDDA